MRASEWQYLCAVHDPPKSCCAIDYCCHTLDWAANTLTSPKHFPSRLALGTETNSAHQQVRQLTNIFRRVYRIFAHAWFQHRDMFWKVENKSGLYIFFKTVCDVYSLIPEDNFTIPSEAEGIDSTPVSTAMNPPTILQKDDQIQATNENGPEGAADTTMASGNTAKRHRPTPSIGATSVATVVEENEEEEEHQPKEDALKPESESGSELIPTPGPESEPEPETEAEVESEVKPKAEPEVGKGEEKPIAVANESGDPAKDEIELEQPQIATTEPGGQSLPEGEDFQTEKEEKSGADQTSEAPVEKTTAEKEKSAAGDAGEGD
jgi:Mob1/phocein family